MELVCSQAGSSKFNLTGGSLGYLNTLPASKFIYQEIKMPTFS